MRVNELSVQTNRETETCHSHTHIHTYREREATRDRHHYKETKRQICPALSPFFSLSLVDTFCRLFILVVWFSFFLNLPPCLISLSLVDMCLILILSQIVTMNVCYRKAEDKRERFLAMKERKFAQAQKVRAAAKAEALARFPEYNAELRQRALQQ